MLSNTKRMHQVDRQGVAGFGSGFEKCKSECEKVFEFKINWQGKIYQNIKNTALKNLTIMAGKQITQKVIDFEFSRIQMKDQMQYHYDERAEMAKFTQWNLTNIILSIGFIEKAHYSIKWVGHDQLSYLDAFIYCLFQGCRSYYAVQNQIFIQLKFSIYQLAAKFLRVSDQKSVVETLCAAQYAKNLPQFLNRSKIIYNLFDKLLKSYLLSIKAEYQSEFQDLKMFSKMFGFIKLDTMSQFVSCFQHFGQRFYIIKEKGCVFVVQLEEEKKYFRQLNKIVENQQESQVQHQKQSEKIFSEFTIQDKAIQNEIKKVSEYAVPQFIKNAANKNRKRKARYTEMQAENEDEFFIQSKRNSKPKFKSSDPITKTGSHTKQDSNQHSRSHKRGEDQVNISSNSPPKNKTLSKQKMNKDNLYYKSSTRRIKTGLIQTSPGKRQTDKTDSNPKQRSNDITFDSRQSRKTSLKKIQLNLKKISDLKSNRIGHYHTQTNSYKDLPKHEPRSYIQFRNSSNVISMNSIIRSMNSISSPKHQYYCNFT